MSLKSPYTRLAMDPPAQTGNNFGTSSVPLVHAIRDEDDSQVCYLLIFASLYWMSFLVHQFKPVLNQSSCYKLCRRNRSIAYSGGTFRVNHSDCSGPANKQVSRLAMVALQTYEGLTSQNRGKIERPFLLLSSSRQHICWSNHLYDAGIMLAAKSLHFIPDLCSIKRAQMHNLPNSQFEPLRA